MALPPFHDKRVLLPTLGAVLVATLVLATAVWGQGGRIGRPPAAAGPSVSSATSASSAGAPASAATGSTLAPPTTRRHGPLTRVIQWMNEHGPTGGGPSGPDENAYYLMMRGDCAGALAIADKELSGRGRTLYGGAGSACLAAFEGRAELWPRAEAALEKTTGGADRLDCEWRAIYELLRRIVEAHRAEPSARLVKRPVGKRELVCPRFTKVTPDHGPAEGGYTVVLEGENLPHVVGIRFLERWDVEHHLRAVLRDRRHVVITIPRATVPHTRDDPVSITPDGARLWSDATVQFWYDPPARATRVSTSTTTTTTTTPATGSTSTTTPPSSS